MQEGKRRKGGKEGWEGKGRGRTQGCVSIASSQIKTLPLQRWRATFKISAQVSSSLFLSHNTDLGPPYRILVDTNFINFSIQNKIELVQGMMDCLMAKCIPTITDCVLAELEKLGPKYRLALKWVNTLFFLDIQNIEGGEDWLEERRIAKDPRFERLHCDRKCHFQMPICYSWPFITDNGTYADDCLVQRVTVHKCYIVATVRNFFLWYVCVCESITLTLWFIVW